MPAAPAAPLTDDDRAAITRLRAEGRTIKEIAFRLGLRQHQVSSVTCTLPRPARTPARAPKPKGYYRLTDAQRLAVKILHARGVGQREISRRMWISVSSVNCVLSPKHSERAKVVDAWRCPGCGLKLTIDKCLFCRDRAAVERAQRVAG